MIDFQTAAVFIVSMTTIVTSGATDLQNRRIERDYLIQPVPLTDVVIEDSFWSKRLETNRKVTIPHTFKKCEENGRFDNFERAARVLQNDSTLEDRQVRGYSFNDTDPYKVLEGASYGLSVKADPAMDKYLDELIVKIAAAQEPDGYLYTARTINPQKPHNWAGPQRWVNVKKLSHELYNMGHLYEAAVAHYQATGKRTLLDVAMKNADLLCEVFGPGKNEDAPGHQIIEMGLVKLYRVTGQKKYLDMAKFFLDTRGPGDGEYSQAHKKVIEQDEAVGHAVRAMYMYCGMADVAALTAEQSYVTALDRIWQDVVSKKLYITGGIGAQGGNEGFGDPYVLPNISAYCETCAAIANALWNHRMFLTHSDAQYIDVLERIIYNGFLSGISMEGDRFFYPNRLESHSGASRSPWFDCACCPPNVVRFIPSISGFVYAHSDDYLYVNLFIESTATIQMRETKIRIKQQTRYPWDGLVRITIEPQIENEDLTICVRIPGWAQNRPVPSDLYRYMKQSKQSIALKVNGQEEALSIHKGYAHIRRNWKKGDTIEINLPMPVRRVVAHDNVLDDKGRVALERGPIVFCAEGIDNKDGHVLNLLLPDDVELKPEYREDMLNGVTIVRGKGHIVERRIDGTVAMVEEGQDFVAIPYYAWCHRGRSQMAVWLARELSAAKPLPAPTIAHTSRVTVSGGGVRRAQSGRQISALTDQLEPKSSDDHSNPFFHWWPRKGTLEWVQYDFKKPDDVSVVQVYWFDDTGIGECRIPKYWRVLYKDGDEWKPVVNHGPYTVEKDKYNSVTFDKVRTTGLRLEVQLLERFSTGIHEVKIK